MSTERGRDRKPSLSIPPRPTGADRFAEAAAAATRVTSGRWGFLVAGLLVILWASSGPFFGFSDTWQLIINTGTTIVTFLMVFLLQNQQSRESRALHLKLDELILAVREARNELVQIENLTEEQLLELTRRYAQFAEELRDRGDGAGTDHITVK